MSKIAKVLGAMLVLTVVMHTTAAQTLKEVRQVEGITEYALPNGFSLLLAPDASRPTTTVNLTYRVGSGHEGYGETGAAHLLEHMLFKASATVADPKQEMTRRGARWNGTTGVDRTNYFASFNTDPETLDWMVDWLAEAMTQAKLQKSDLDSEMSVVRNELERADSAPAAVLSQRMVSASAWCRPRTTGTVTDTPRWVRAPMWKTSRLKNCAPSMRAITAPTTPCW